MRLDQYRGMPQAVLGSKWAPRALRIPVGTKTLALEQQPSEGVSF